MKISLCFFIIALDDSKDVDLTHTDDEEKQVKIDFQLLQYGIEKDKIIL